MGDKISFYTFPRINIVFVILVPLGMLLLSMLYLTPDWVPYNYLGPVGSLSLYLRNEMPEVLTFLFYAAWALHIVETAFTIRFCWVKNIKEIHLWACTVFIYGWFSMKDLGTFEEKSN